MTITTRFVQACGLQVYLREAGTGLPVVFLHGFPANSWMWRHQMEALSDRWRCIAPDKRGYGLTEKPRIRVSRDLLARDVIDLLDALDLESAVLVGHDWDGIIASATAFRDPERIDRLVLMDTLCSVWPAKGRHGWWFKAEPLPEEFFGHHARDFIGAVFGGRQRPYGGPPETPWPPVTDSGGLAPLAGSLTPLVDGADVEHYAKVFDKPDVWFSAVQYYRNAMPFYREIPDPAASRGFRFQLVPDAEVARMWNDPRPDDYPDEPWFRSSPQRTATSSSSIRHCSSIAR